MTTSPAYSLRNSLLLVVLALALTGCIQPDAPNPDATPTAPLLAAQPPAAETAVSAAPTAPPAQLPTQPPLLLPTSEPAQWIWRYEPVGPEQVVIMFYQQAANRCIRYIFRSKVVARCGSPGQTLVAVSGLELAADNVQHTIISGRIIDERITAVSLEMQDGSSLPMDVNERGFVVILSDGRKPLRAVPVDQFGNLVGTQFNF